VLLDPRAVGVGEGEPGVAGVAVDVFLTLVAFLVTSTYPYPLPTAA